LQEHDIAVVRGSVQNKTAAILIDACSKANIVTRSFLDIGSFTSRVHQAMSDAEEL